MYNKNKNDIQDSVGLFKKYADVDIVPESCKNIKKLESIALFDFTKGKQIDLSISLIFNDFYRTFQLVLWKIDNKNFDIGISTILLNFKNCLAPSPSPTINYYMKFSIVLLQKRFRQFFRFGSIAEIPMSKFLLSIFRFTIKFYIFYIGLSIDMVDYLLQSIKLLYVFWDRFIFNPFLNRI